MAILDSFSSAANQGMMAKIWTNGDTIICLSRKHCGKRRNYVTSNFSFSHNIFKSSLLLMCKSECLWSRGLTLHHTIWTFNDPDKEVFWKQCGKRRKCWWPAFSPFPTMFYTFPKANFSVWVTFNLSSANAFDFDKSTILSLGIELSLNASQDYRWLWDQFRSKITLHKTCSLIFDLPCLLYWNMLDMGNKNL